MRGDWRHEAMEYRDIDREAQARAEKELGAVMNGLAESVAELPDAELLAEAREAGEDPAAIAARTRCVIAAAQERAEKAPTIVDGCHELGLSLPVSAADLHETYVAFRLAGIEPNTTETPCWRGVCDCLESYGTDLKHAGARQRIMEHLEMLTPEREPD